jgi:hypothetical protein
MSCLLLILLVAGPALAAGRGPQRVYLACGLADDDLTAFSAHVAADADAVLLIDTPEAKGANAAFLAAAPDAVLTAVGDTDAAAVEKRVGRRPAAVLSWPDRVWGALFAQPQRVVVCRSQPRRLFLHAAALAGTAGAPLVVLRTPDDEAELRRRLAAWRPTEVFAVGVGGDALRDRPDGCRITSLTTSAAALTAALKLIGHPSALVVANPDDQRQGQGGMSGFAPYVAARKRAALVLTDEAGDARAAVEAALKRPALARADALVLVAGLQAIPTERRANPQPGKDPEVFADPLTPHGDEPFTFATGRLFHDDPGCLALLLARQALLAARPGPRRALVASNPGGGLPLLETFSRHTARELANAGYRTTAFFGDDVDRDKVRKLMPEQDLFLWEGHYGTLVKEFGFLTWDEPLPASLIVLQSCLALKEEEAAPLFRRGAVGVVGSATRTYSGSGGAFTVAFLDALNYEGQSLGGGLRQAKNFLLAYSLLKEKRLGEKAKLGGANVRSALAFSLWGDPTLTLPRPEPGEGALAPVRHEVKGNSIVISLPDTAYEPVKVKHYEARMRPNARLAGLLTTPDDEDVKEFVPFIFCEVHLPRAPEGKTPRLTSRLNERSWAFLWDARRRSGYLLLTPRQRDTREARFHVEWE